MGTQKQYSIGDIKRKKNPILQPFLKEIFTLQTQIITELEKLITLLESSQQLQEMESLDIREMEVLQLMLHYFFLME